MLYVLYRSISRAFFQLEGAFIPWHSSHQRSAATVCLSKGLLNSAPGISAAHSTALKEDPDASLEVASITFTGL